MFESVDARTDGRRLECHPISSYRAFGSGELKTYNFVYYYPGLFSCNKIRFSGDNLTRLNISVASFVFNVSV